VELPLSDPQFWLVSAGAALVLGLALRRARQRARDKSGVACDRCPKPHGPRRLGALAAALLGAAGAAHAASVAREVAVMGTTLRVEVEVTNGRSDALAIAEALVREIEAAEARLSTWRDTSELARLNRTPVGEWIESAAAPELAAAARCARETGFAFHPSIGRLVEAWGLRGGGRVPTSTELAAARRDLDEVGYESAEVAGRVRKTADVAIEEGAFGKGAGLDAALSRLEMLPRKERAGFVRLDLGGQIAWANARSPVRLELADPRQRSRPVLEIAVADRRASLASSGDSEKQFTFNGKSFGHLIDPRTGAPAPDFGSVAVVAANALAADCLSTALFVMGPDDGSRWLAEHAREIEAAYLVVDGGRLRAKLTPELARRARPLVEELEVEVLNGSS